jgi:oligoribonuclease NrnB/cAMP/cGMP phosphodiesterase (DHH superfamily)
MRTLVFSHEQDVDGIFSAAIIRLAFPDCEIILTNYGLENMLFVADKIRSAVSHDGGTIIMADIGANEESYAPLLETLQLAKASGWSNIWLDHHIWPQGPRLELGEVCEMVLFRETDGVKKCTAELCVERFIPENKYAMQLASIAHRTDFPDSARFPIPPITALISYYLGFPALRNRLQDVILRNVVKGILWDSQMQADVMEASYLIEESMAKSVAEMIQKEFQLPDGQMSVRVAIAKADSFVNRSMLLGKIMDESKIPIGIAYTDDGKISIRKKDGAPTFVDCSKIAHEFKEGGGHVPAAGGFLRADPRISGNAVAISEITSALESYFAKIT